MKKQWHMINAVAQRFGACHEQASQRIGSGSNDNDIIKLAHKLFEATENKKCNFVRHWKELEGNKNEDLNQLRVKVSRE